MKKYLLKSFLVLLCLTVLFSCNNNDEQKTDSYFNQLIKTEKGIIRGVHFNDKIHQIKRKENDASIISETEFLLEYEYTLTEGGTYLITYHFDDHGCYEMNVDTYIEAEDPTKKTNDIGDILNSYFDNKYGTPEQDEGLLIWNNKDKSITVELDYINKAEGEIMLTIFANE